MRERGSRRGKRDEEEEGGCKRGGGGLWGKPIIVQITGRLWIFYQASSAALSFSFCHSVYFCLTVLVANLNYIPFKLHLRELLLTWWKSPPYRFYDAVSCFSLWVCVQLNYFHRWSVEMCQTQRLTCCQYPPRLFMCVCVTVTRRQLHCLICIVMLPFCIRHLLSRTAVEFLSVLANW